MMLAKLYCIPYHQKYGTKLTTTKMVTFWIRQIELGIKATR
jgi:hypothetical protein